ncbi:hypothetical protein F5H01DRAFT_346974 [Linnemannia elongata]|nr:hypothetical protein F5H01DRAFT_346974 [Linnemannia elongata]
MASSRTVHHSRNHFPAIRLHSTFLLSTFLFLIGTLSSVYAQSYQPAPMWGMSSVFVAGRALYVHGGRILQQSSSSTMVSTSITFSLDLSTAWETSQPNFTLMTTEGPTDYLFTSTLILNDNVWMMISNATGSLLRLDRTVDIWSEVTLGADNVSKDKGLAAATDPITGSIYIINGGLEKGAKKLYTYNNILNLYKEIGQTVPMESGFAASWSVERKRMYIHGGIQGNVLQSVLYEFLPSNDAPLIQFVPTSGDAPTARQGHCMVSAYGGTRMIVFGGFGNGTTPLSDIYFLESNSTSTKWTKGTDGGDSVARAHTACAVTNDLFVAWGGTKDGVNTITSNITIVYNLKTNQWQTTYSPLPYVAPSTATTPGTGSGTGAGAGLKPTGTGGATDSASNTGAIIGGVVGGWVVIGIVVGLFIYRKVQGKSNTDAAASKPQSIHKGNINHIDTNNNNFDEVPVSVAPPQYNIFQPLAITSSAAAGPSYQLAYIDHYQQQQVQQQQQQQEQLQQQQYRHPQDRQQQEGASLRTSPTVPFAASSPVNSVHTSTVSSSPRPALMYSTKPKINPSDAELLYLPETRHPHTSGDGLISMDTPEKHPHTQPQ